MTWLMLYANPEDEDQSANPCSLVSMLMYSLVENQNYLELDFFKFFSLLILVVGALYLMNPSDATLASLSVLKYSRWRPRWPSVRLLRPI